MDRRLFVVVKDGHENAGKIGLVLGGSVFIEQEWVPVLWQDADDPDWFKESGLAFIEEDKLMNSIFRQDLNELYF